MNLTPAAACFALLALLSMLPVGGQTTPNVDPSSPDTPPPGATVITSDELRMDQLAHTAVFTGTVVVVGSNFNMTCELMTVYFNNANKINTIVAEGNVVIIQPGRITHCGHAIYYHDKDKFDLTDQPDILDNKNEIKAPEIIIYRMKKELITKGRTKTTIIEGIGASTNSTPNPAQPEQ